MFNPDFGDHITIFKYFAIRQPFNWSRIDAHCSWISLTVLSLSISLYLSLSLHLYPISTPSQLQSRQVVSGKAYVMEFNAKAKLFLCAEQQRKSPTCIYRLIFRRPSEGWEVNSAQAWHGQTPLAAKRLSQGSAWHWPTLAQPKEPDEAGKVRR